MTPMQKQRLDAIRGLRPVNAAEAPRRQITDVTEGGYIELASQTWGLNSQVWQVKRINRYLDVRWKNFAKRAKDYWVHELELFSLNDGKTLFIEWEIDDHLEISITKKEIPMREIHYKGKAIKFSDLLEIAEEEEGEVVVNDGSLDAHVTFAYSEDETWAARYYSGSSDSDGDNVRFFEFESADNQEALTIEAWETHPEDKPEREAFISRSMPASDITVLQAGPV